MTTHCSKLLAKLCQYYNSVSTIDMCATKFHCIFAPTYSLYHISSWPLLHCKLNDASSNLSVIRSSQSHGFHGNVIPLACRWYSSRDQYCKFFMKPLPDVRIELQLIMQCQHIAKFWPLRLSSSSFGGVAGDETRCKG